MTTKSSLSILGILLAVLVVSVWLRTPKSGTLFPERGKFRADKSLIPPKVRRLKIGMSWRDTLLALPESFDRKAEFEKTGSGKLAADSQSLPEITYLLPNLGSVEVKFIDGRINSVVLGYATTDPIKEQEMREEMEDNFGPPVSVRKLENVGTQILTWERDNIKYELNIPNLDGSSCIALRVSKTNK